MSRNSPEDNCNLDIIYFKHEDVGERGKAGRFCRGVDVEGERSLGKFPIFMTLPLRADPSPRGEPRDSESRGQSSGRAR